MHADTSVSGPAFPKTVWRRVELAAAGDQEAIGELYRGYRRPLLTYLLYKLNLPEVQAEELVQDFLTDRLPRCAAKADAEVSKFRNLLLTALVNYARDRMRKDGAACRKPKGGFVSIDSPDVPDVPLRITDTEAELEWTRTVIAETLRRVQNFYNRKGKERYWVAFEKKIIIPVLEGAKPMPLRELAKLGFESPQAVSNALLGAKRKFEQFLRQVVIEYTGHRDEAETEIRQIKNCLSQSTEKTSENLP
ncbi:MAG TPA: hypothetical protein VNU68_04620 [Verrucomicrobiae bacterium]|nr:hypothetical protein [Verrucomicrobiae bacterium]